MSENETKQDEQEIRVKPLVGEAQAAAETVVAAETAVSVEKMREADRYTIASGTPSRELMRRAAQGVFDAYDDWKGSNVGAIED